MPVKSRKQVTKAIRALMREASADDWALLGSYGNMRALQARQQEQRQGDAELAPYLEELRSLREALQVRGSRVVPVEMLADQRVDALDDGSVSVKVHLYGNASIVNWAQLETTFTTRARRNPVYQELLARANAILAILSPEGKDAAIAVLQGRQQ